MLASLLLSLISLIIGDKLNHLTFCIDSKVYWWFGICKWQLWEMVTPLHVFFFFFKERENPLLSLNLQIPMMISILDCKWCLAVSFIVGIMALQERGCQVGKSPLRTIQNATLPHKNLVIHLKGALLVVHLLVLSHKDLDWNEQ